MDGEAMEIPELRELVRQKIENLRPKLLDLSRRNPLLATKLSPRSNAHIRVVDELPDVLFYKLGNGQEMRLVPLPEIAGDPKDEDVKGFRDALSAARLIDERYLHELEAIDRDADDYLDRTRSIERALKDRLRDEFGLPPRPKQVETNLTQHARNNGIAPSYELPLPDSESEDERHTDDDIQILLLPKDLERKLNNISAKCRTWVQETGINVLHVAYGFLEWSEPNQTESAFAPLILCSAQIEKKRTRDGVEFLIFGAGEEAEVNAVLAEKLRISFGIELPQFAGGSVEEYMTAIGEIAPKVITWKVRRQVAIGVFPSARMAMYHDLNPNHPTFPDNDIVRSLLAGINTEASLPFAEEYNVDEPSIEKRVPYIVMDADSSQVSTLVDIAIGKNLAVEGPPGTGKSQTIVNAIAAALASGKKVLFVAEKLAALNVVRSRLEAVGLGEFLLPLQADRSTREQVIGAIRRRIEMTRPNSTKDYDVQLSEYRYVRQQLSDYIDLLTINFGTSGLTIHEIMGKSIATAHRLEAVPPEIIDQSDILETFLHKVGISRLRAMGHRVEKAALVAAQAKPDWKASRLVHAERFTVDDACNIAGQAGKLFRDLALARDSLPSYRIERATDEEDLTAIQGALFGLAKLPDKDRELHLALLQPGAEELLASFIVACETYRLEESALNEVFAASLDQITKEAVERAAEICEIGAFDTLNCEELQTRLAKLREKQEVSRSFVATMTPLIQLRPEAMHWNLRAIGQAFKIIMKTGSQALLCRNKATNDPAALPGLKVLITEAYALQCEKAKLAERVAFSSDISSEALIQTIATLRRGGRFAVFSSSYRYAKKLAHTLILTERFDKQDALVHLEALASYRNRERAFLQNLQAPLLFGLHFRGVDTDFAPFEALVEYYEFIQSYLTGPEMRGLRNFLRDAEYDELEVLPTIPTDCTSDTISHLIMESDELEHDIAATSSGLSDLQPLLVLFRNPKSVSPIDLSKLAARLKALLIHRSILNSDQITANVLGNRFAGANTEVEPLKPACDWALGAASVADAVAAIIRGGRPAEAASQIEHLLKTKAQICLLLDKLSRLARIDQTYFTDGRTELEIAAALETAAQDAEGLFAHAALTTTLFELDTTGALPLATHLMASGVPTGLAEQLEALAFRKLARAVFSDHGTKLSQYPGSRLDELRATLARQDREIIKLAQKQLRWKVHADAKPTYGNGVGKKSTWTQMALIDNEINKQQRFISVRDLTQRAGRALLELQPCWIMSPLAVAQYIPRNAITFDLCIIDEASQMPPEDAIGALLRCKQTVVVGDTNQLPPSSFFRKMIDDEDADEDEAVLSESILEMANATFRPARRLRWHYRSRHSGLIKFSNKLVYNDDLIVFPSATESMARMGVEFRKVNGIYKAGTNAIEAQAMVDAALELMRLDPNRSLGIVTLNQKQKDLITEEFEYALGRDRYAQAYVAEWKDRHDGLEEFFIKNLENVQGDERDVIFIGTVYGPESDSARVAQRFGPINGLAGKRRLNVLFSRAKEKIVTFSSMTASDIVAEADGNAGAYMLKRWLEYVATGVLESGITTAKEPDSDFEVFVMDQIRAIGCEPVPQVGAAGYFVDIGVRHSDWPYGFILGVECDGASYHSAKSARDRDRLRQEVLERLGWHFHRIWSTDWFNNPRREVERLRDVIAARMKVLKQREAEFQVRPAFFDPKSEIQSSESASTVDLPLFSPSSQSDLQVKPEQPANDRSVAIGDTVRVRYLTGDCKVLMVTISASKGDLDQGIIHHEAPLAKALLGADEGDEVEVLNGPYVRLALIESIIKKG